MHIPNAPRCTHMSTAHAGAMRHRMHGLCRDFHTYRGYRAKELERLKDFDKDKKREEAQKEWEKERDEMAAEVAPAQ